MPFNSFENYPMSWKPRIDKTVKTPLYILLAEQLEEDIRNQRLLPGTKLPPQRELADYLDLNPSTVYKAFAICTKKGLLTGNVGRGTFVAYDFKTPIRLDGPEKEDELIDLGVNLPESVRRSDVDEMLRMMLEDAGQELFPIRTAEWQRDAGSQLMNRFGYSTLPERICISTGGQNALSAVFQSLFRRGDRIGTDPLGYYGLKSIAAQAGIQLVPVASEDDEMTQEGLDHAIHTDGIRALYVMPDNHNPTTHRMSLNCRRRIAETVEKEGILVIEDSIDRLLEETALPTIQSLVPDRTVAILSLTKPVSPVLRLGYISVPSLYTNTLNQSFYNLNLADSPLILEIASRYILSGKIDSLIERNRINLSARNGLVDRILDGYAVRGNLYSQERWLVLPEGMNNQAFEKDLYHHGVFLYGSEHFAIGKECPVEAVRISVCTPSTMERLERGLWVIRQRLDELTQ